MLPSSSGVTSTWAQAAAATPIGTMKTSARRCVVCRAICARRCAVCRAVCRAVCARRCAVCRAVLLRVAAANGAAVAQPWRPRRGVQCRGLRSRVRVRVRRV
eukprot:7280303-Prymnesium_polylepis.1